MSRLSDFLLAVLLLIFLAPVLITVYLLILIVDGRPVFFLSKRMKSVDEDFTLIKFRTLKTALDDKGDGVTGGDKSNRLFFGSSMLRRTRLDELPQLINILKGDVSFVGPRPPLRSHVNKFQSEFSEILQVKPGVMGLGSLLIHHYEEKLLSKARSSDDTEEIYIKRCIPKKLQIERVYVANKSICYDVVIIIQTVKEIFLRVTR